MANLGTVLRHRGPGHVEVHEIVLPIPFVEIFFVAKTPYPALIHRIRAGGQLDGRWVRIGLD